MCLCEGRMKEMRRRVGILCRGYGGILGKDGEGFSKDGGDCRGGGRVDLGDILEKESVGFVIVWEWEVKRGNGFKVIVRF